MPGSPAIRSGLTVPSRVVGMGFGWHNGGEGGEGAEGAQMPLTTVATCYMDMDKDMEGGSLGSRRVLSLSRD